MVPIDLVIYLALAGIALGYLIRWAQETPKPRRLPASAYFNRANNLPPAMGAWDADAARELRASRTVH